VGHWETLESRGLPGTCRCQWWCAAPGVRTSRGAGTKCSRARGEERLEIEVALVEVELEGLEADAGVAEEEQVVDEVDEPRSVLAPLNAR
jgi:hypothetical protein